MNRNQLQALITAGVFSSALLSGVAYADDSKTTTAPAQVDVSTPTPKAATPAAKTKDSQKDASQHGCSGANGCGGK